MNLARSEHKENSRAWWDERYQKSGAEYLYSKQPSDFLFQHLDLLPKNAKILELACGEGRNSVALATKGYAVSALDWSATALERAKKLAEASGVTVEFKSQDLDFYLPDLLTFDAIVAIDYKAPPTMVKNVARGLKPNGILLIECPHMEQAKTNKSLEVFECYKTNELLQAFSNQANFQVLFYSELSPGKWGDKVFLIAKKSQLL